MKTHNEIQQFKSRGDYKRFIRAQINDIPMMGVKTVDTGGKHKTIFAATAHRIGTEEGKIFRVKTDKESGVVSVTRVY